MSQETTLTLDEFGEFGGDKDKLTADEFKRLLINAEQTLNSITRGVYEDPKKLDDDYNSVRFKLRARRFKQALTQQIRFYMDLKGTTAATLSGKIKSQSIGDTSVSYGDGLTGHNGNPATTAPEVYALLEDTGLLYRGATLCRHF